MYTQKSQLPSQLAIQSYVTQIRWDELMLDATPIGHSSYANVYKGSWKGVKVAVKELHLKTLPEQSLKDFENNIKIMAQCQHSNIVSFIGTCIEPGHYSIVMEYMPMGSLFNLLHNSAIELPWALRYQMAIDIATGLQFLHAKGILHHDLKSPHIMLNKYYQAKIAYYGLSKIKFETSSYSTGIHDGGAIRWRAPELFKRGIKLTPETDIYSLGMVLWEIATRNLPYADALDETTVGIWIREGEQEVIPPETPKPYAEVIKKTWLTSKSRPSASEVVVELEKIILFLPSIATTTTTTTTTVTTTTTFIIRFILYYISTIYFLKFPTVFGSNCLNKQLK